MNDAHMNTQRPLTLGSQRDKALQHAAELVSQAWRDFDRAREQEHLPSAELLERLSSSLPEFGCDPTAGLDVAAEILDTSLAQSRPRYLAYIGSSGLEIGALADLLAHSYDVNLALEAGGASRVEDQAIRWLGEFIGFPSTAGYFTSGGTISNISALATARERAMPGARATGMSGLKAAVYCSAEVHYSVRRAVELLGLGSQWLRAIELDEQRRMSPTSLRETIQKDIADGVTPMAVVATGGTTLTGAVDSLNDIADVCEEFGIWLHVDGAYGLPAAGVDQTRDLFAGLHRVDSVSVDAHKWLFVPKACSALLVKDKTALIRTFGHNEAYIPHDGDDANAVDATLEYSRPLRALKLWLAFTVHGAGEFRSAIANNLNEARLLYDMASADSEFQVLPHRPTLSIIPIRHLPAGMEPEDARVDSHNLALCQAIQADGRVFLSSATIDGQTWLRPCFTNFRTTDDDVREVVAVVKEVASRMSM
jgi:aromatic-L-amino-acid/L-tryptophan decarboxylase